MNQLIFISLLSFLFAAVQIREVTPNKVEAHTVGAGGEKIDNTLEVKDHSADFSRHSKKTGPGGEHYESYSSGHFYVSTGDDKKDRETIQKYVQDLELDVPQLKDRV
jgi:hypothetical protein